MIPWCLSDVVRVDLGDDQRDVGVHPEGARVVDDDGAGLRRDRAPLARDAGRRARQDDLDARERAGRQGSDRMTSRRGTSTDLARAPLRGEELDRRRPGNRRSSSRRIIRSPTAPLAPTTATCFTVDSPSRCAAPHRSLPDDRTHRPSAERFADGRATGRTEISPTIRFDHREIQASRIDRPRRGHSQLSGGRRPSIEWMRESEAAGSILADGGECALKVLVIGKGGREHALCWKLKQSPRVTAVFCARATPARPSTCRTSSIEPGDFRGPDPVRQARRDRPDGRRPRGAAGQGDRRRLPARGPADLRPAEGSGRARGEQGLRQGADAAGGHPDGRLPGLPLGARRRALRPLARGRADRPLARAARRSATRCTAGPPARRSRRSTGSWTRARCSARASRSRSRSAARSASSTPPPRPATSSSAARSGWCSRPTAWPPARGSTSATTSARPSRRIDQIMVRRIFGQAGDRLIIEERLDGQEASVLALTDGRTIIPLESSQDYKRAFDHDEGPNTGGMGAFSPTPSVTPELMEQVEREILVPVIHALKRARRPFRGVLYAGLMLTNQGPEGPRVQRPVRRPGDPGRAHAAQVRPARCPRGRRRRTARHRHARVGPAARGDRRHGVRGLPRPLRARPA